MSRNKDYAWKTKYGRRRVRQEAPTLEEAIAAAQGLSDDFNAQVEIAASLIGLPTEQVRAALGKVAAPRKDVIKSTVSTGSGPARRVFVVERKPGRRAIAS